MFPGIGTVLNISTIIIGGTLGVFIGAKISEKLRNLIIDVLGCVTIISAADALSAYWDKELTNAIPRGWVIIVIIFSLLIGALIGTVLQIEDRLENLGENLKRRFSSSSGSNFVDGFVSASLIFAIGPLAILGSISDGMGTGIDQLVLKMLKLDGTFVVIALPGKPYQINVGTMLDQRRSLAGSMIGGMAELQEMLNFCGQHNIVSDVEVIKADYINTAYERTVASDVKYRFVIDAKSF